MRLATLILLVLLVPVACQKDESPEPAYMQEAEPPMETGQGRAFARYMLEHLEPTLEEVTCHCCDKTLARCYRDTIEDRPGACPDTWPVCQHEGRDVLAAKRQGISDEEIVSMIEAKYGSAGHGQ